MNGNGMHQIEGEISDIRGRLDQSLAELDRRRHEATDVKLQIRRHPAVVAAAGGIVRANPRGREMGIARTTVMRMKTEGARFGILESGFVVCEERLL